MKTFSDLVFKSHSVGTGTHARLDFTNGWGVSVVTGTMFYTSKAEPYELAIFLDCI